MRILFVISGLGLGGAERQVVLISRELVRRGHSVCVYALTDIVPRADELAGTRVELVVDPKRIRLDPGVLWRLHHHVVNWRPDIVHGFLFDGNLYSRLGSIGTGVPVLNSERSDDYKLQTLNSIGYRLTSALTRGVVANSHRGAKFALRLHRVGPNNVHVLWNGIDLQELDLRLSKSWKPAQQLIPGANLKRLCIIGRVKPEKDYQLALRVARRLVSIDSSWRLLCVGEDKPYECMDYAAQVIACRDSLKLQEFVKFVGIRRDATEIIAPCDVLLVTSVNEGFPNVVLEAMSCGTPVASTDYSDVRRILPMPWQVVKSRDESELVAAILRCHAERDAVGAAQRRWVEKHATVEISVDTLQTVYESYLSCSEALGERVS